MSEELPHSQLYFTDARDHIWNADFIELIAKRTGLAKARRVLDVGAGQGHFARTWAPHLAPGFEIVCIDPEPRSLAVAEERCRALKERTGLDGRFTFVEGRAEALPFDDASFDAAICQTVLIHVADPARVVREMTRVVRSGGVVLASEPNNAATAQSIAAEGPDASPEQALTSLRFQLTVVRGKHRLGLGWNNAGVHLPRYFSGLSNVRYWTDDRPEVLAPPYASEMERATIADFRSRLAAGIFGWPREEARRYYVAGGGEPSSFDGDYDACLAREAAFVAAIDRGEYCCVEAIVLFIAAGTKP
jgi:ubiquinone/menaquinone biosynthesis C-methylase UbiE